MEVINLMQTIKEALTTENKTQLIEIFSSTHPASAAEALRELNLEKADLKTILDCLPQHLIAKLFEHLNSEQRTEVASLMSDTDIAAVVAMMSADDCVDFLQALEDRKETIIRLLASEV